MCVQLKLHYMNERVVLSTLLYKTGTVLKTKGAFFLNVARCFRSPLWLSQMTLITLHWRSTAVHTG